MLHVSNVEVYRSKRDILYVYDDSLTVFEISTYICVRKTLYVVVSRVIFFLLIMLIYECIGL